MRLDENIDCRRRRPLLSLRGMSAALACHWGVDVSSALAQSQTLGQQNGTYITFGSGGITAPSENNLTPTNTATASTGGGATSGTNLPGASGISAATNWPLIIGISIGGLAIAGIGIALILKK